MTAAAVEESASQPTVPTYVRLTPDDTIEPDNSNLPLLQEGGIFSM